MQNTQRVERIFSLVASNNNVNNKFKLCPAQAETEGGGAKDAPGTRRGVVKGGCSGDKIVKSFNTWAFKREQPDGAERLSALAAEAAALGEPLSFVLYWGKGPRDGLDTPDITCLDYLKSMADRIGQIHGPGASIRLIFTDTHAKLNGHAPAAMDGYFAAVDDAARKRGFATARLSDIVDFARETVDIESHEQPSGEVLRNLIACAEKWYRGEGSKEQGALDYHRMNMAEKRAIEVAFPSSVFVTFNSSEFRDLFPATMPIFYMYSLRRGVGVKPWFMSSGAGAAETPEDVALAS